ncbi:MAG: thymidine kinase [Flavobacteriaceae bacterium]|nr:thymidine kinase [Flavobacteriaceae bacterium]|tara:strand:+ start:3770 stop:4351 length:582 start_codon:yes stop_codon:yes gene_type:complete
MFLENNIKSSQQFGSIEVICGSMFSGKTEKLIQRVKKARAIGMKVKVFKPLIDNRYSNISVVSHNDNKLKATIVKSPEEIKKYSTGYNFIAIDEAQFFDNGIIEVCNTLANKGTKIIIAGLDMDYKGNPFGPMPYLMSISEYVTKLHATCSRTGNLAQFTYRKNKNDNLIVIGEKDQYEALSRNAFYATIKTK